MPPTGWRSKKFNTDICAVEGCGKTREARGFCMFHYRRLIRTGHPSEANCISCGDLFVLLESRLEKRGHRYANHVCDRCWALWDYVPINAVRCHNMTIAGYISRYLEQEGNCLCCGRHFPITIWEIGRDQRMEYLFIDHDHSCCNRESGRTCGKCTRGLVCHYCNTALGFIERGSATLDQYDKYLTATSR